MLNLHVGITKENELVLFEEGNNDIEKEIISDSIYRRNNSKLVQEVLFENPDDFDEEDEVPVCFIKENYPLVKNVFLSLKEENINTHKEQSDSGFQINVKGCFPNFEIPDEPGIYDLESLIINESLKRLQNKLDDLLLCSVGLSGRSGGWLEIGINGINLKEYYNAFKEYENYDEFVSNTDASPIELYDCLKSILIFKQYIKDIIKNELVAINNDLKNNL